MSMARKKKISKVGIWREGVKSKDFILGPSMLYDLEYWKIKKCHISENEYDRDENFRISVQ